MLVQFRVRNWRSIRDEQSLIMVQAKSDELADTNTFTTGAPSSINLLRSAVIYGANAAGKTNVIRSIAAMRDLILESDDRTDGVFSEPFMLDAGTSETPSEFEVVFIIADVKYVYGFTSDSDRFHDEWLFAYPNGRAQKWFVREWNEATDTYDWDFGSSLSGHKKVWQDATRDDSLLLSTAVKLNSKQLKPIYDWFKRTLRVASINGFTDSFTAKLCTNEQTKKDVLNFLKSADIDIDDIKVETEKFSADHLPVSMPTEVKNQIIESVKDREIYNISTLHKTADGFDVEFDFEDESNGTQKLFSFSGPWLNVLEKGRVLFIDELNDSLHPEIVKFLVQFFHSSVTNPNNAQLIFTTHETSILDQDIFRRDQIWFCEKDREQATNLYPLTDFSPRKGRENIKEGYLTGRYGALPYVKKYVLE
ncbi:AAA family ATPase [Pseudomonas gregormendelii]